MPIIRKRLFPDEVYPEELRYNADTDQIERLVDGEWKPAPESDPRRLTTIPPRITADPKCDAAQSVVDAFSNKIGEVITAIDGGMTALQIAGLILGLFSFGVFAVLIELFLFLADLMLSAGASALTDALTPEVYDELKCILYCTMDEEGRIDEAGLTSVIAAVNADIGGLAGVVLSSMLSLAGFGGVSNLAALGTSTGDCSDCDDCCIFGWSPYYNLLPESAEIDVLSPGASFPASGSVQILSTTTVVLSWSLARKITKVEMRIARFSSDVTQPIWDITANDTISGVASPTLPQNGQLLFREFLFTDEQETAMVTVKCDNALMHSIRVWYCQP